MPENETAAPDRYDTPEQVALNMAKWREAMEISHEMLMAGLRDQVGPHGDLAAAYRNWNCQRREKKLRALELAAQRYRDRRSRSSEKSDAS